MEMNLQSLQGMESGKKIQVGLGGGKLRKLLGVYSWELRKW